MYDSRSKSRLGDAAISENWEQVCLHVYFACGMKQARISVPRNDKWPRFEAQKV